MNNALHSVVSTYMAAAVVGATLDKLKVSANISAEENTKVSVDAIKKIAAVQTPSV